ncbi:hypothetical protein ANN_15349 [Periplaneta americana]|uniref:Uncharacterized protein n=1 Tax=Periplaneta americana TaxID=6978 RepID=A0ABQ8SG59_PERAM|nr:hypothetical protein ANN_15349 [Periplaneta americana]
MSPGSSTESYPAFARTGLKENPGKNLNQITCPDRDSNPGHLVSRPDALALTPQVWTILIALILTLSNSTRRWLAMLVLHYNSRGENATREHIVARNDSCVFLLLPAFPNSHPLTHWSQTPFLFQLSEDKMNLTSDTEKATRPGDNDIGWPVLFPLHCIHRQLATYYTNQTSDAYKQLFFLLHISEVRAVEIKLDSLPGSEAQLLRDKFQNVFGKNSGYKKMCKVAQVLEDVPVGEIDGVSVCDISLFKYARLTSCDVERSFSQYKSLFRDNRHAFVMENLEMTIVVHCNSRPTTSTHVWLTRMLVFNGRLITLLRGAVTPRDCSKMRLTSEI